MWLQRLYFAVLATFQRRLPRTRDLLTVFSFVLFISAGWSIFSFLFNLPSSLYYFDAFEILSVFSYTMMFTLFESLLIISVLSALSFVLPNTWFREGFAYKASLAIIVGVIASVRLQDSLFLEKAPNLRSVAAGALLALAACVLLIWFFQKFPVLQKILLQVVERFEIFSYIYVPLGLVGLVIVLMRNLLL